MTPERQRELLSATPLGHWVASFGFDPDKHPKDAHGRWEARHAAGLTNGVYDPHTDYGESEFRPSLVVLPGKLPESLRQRAATWSKALTPDERDAVIDYTYHGYKPLNRAMRAAGGDASKVPDDFGYTSAKRTLRAMAAVLLTANAKVQSHDPPLTVWRSMGLTTEEIVPFVEAAEAAAANNALISMPVFSSATLNPSFAAQMSGPATAWTPERMKDPLLNGPKVKHTILLEIRSRTGMPMGPAGIGLAFENEVLQSPQAVYRVLGWKSVQFGSDKRRVLRLEEVVPATPSDTTKSSPAPEASSDKPGI